MEKLLINLLAERHVKYVELQDLTNENTLKKELSTEEANTNFSPMITKS
jgi:hypothetical protein